MSTSIAGLVAGSEQLPPNGGKIEGGSLLTGHLNLASLLVREAVQNAWDARDDDRGDAPVLFSIRGWDLDADELERLRSLLPVEGLGGFREDDGPGILHPSKVLSQHAVKVLVISDRNTVGLCGPTRSGRRWDPVRKGKELRRGQQRFANFVRNSGRATADTGRGDGGAYGVGKTALWMASACGTVLIHSRTTDEHGEPVERFIGSLYGDHFFDGEDEYTGRHFVGRQDSDGVVEPLEGADAAAAARCLPLPAYDFDGAPADGTSIVIVAPRLALPWQVEMERLRDAVRWHVWPKRVAGAREAHAGPDMDIRLYWNNHPVDVPDPLDDPELRPFARALLDCARDRNSDEGGRDYDVRCLRPAKLLGTVKFRQAGTTDDNVFHLTLSEQALESSAAEESPKALPADTEPVIDFHRPWGQIALIRREPLLLVRYEPIGGPEAAATEVGVFLSAEDVEVEGALTKAEPPAHDDWIHRNVPKESSTDHRRTFAKRTLDGIRRAKSDLLTTYRNQVQTHAGSAEAQVSKRISDGLMGGVGGRVKPTTGERGGTPGAKPKATLKLVRSDQDGDTTVHELDVQVIGLSAGISDVTLTAEGTGYDNVGSMPVDGHVRFSWTTPDGSRLAAPTAHVETRGAAELRATLVVHVSGSLRFRPKVSVEVGGHA